MLIFPEIQCISWEQENTIAKWEENGYDIKVKVLTTAAMRFFIWN